MYSVILSFLIILLVLVLYFLIISLLVYYSCLRNFWYSTFYVLFLYLNLVWFFICFELSLSLETLIRSPDSFMFDDSSLKDLMISSLLQSNSVGGQTIPAYTFLFNFLDFRFSFGFGSFSFGLVYIVLYGLLISLVAAEFISFVCLFNIVLVMLVYVSSTVVVYSWNYMNGDDVVGFLVLLIVFILVMYLFLANSGFSLGSLIFVFVWWEYLGICSYGLIGWWSSSVNCAIKAVVFNKFGDISFICFICLVFSVFNSFSCLVLINSLFSFYSSG